ILPETRGFGVVDVRIAPDNGDSVTIEVAVSGGGLRPGDVDDPTDLQPGEAFVHVTRPDGFDIAIHTNNAGVTKDNRLVVIGADGLALMADFGRPELVVGERQVIAAELSVDNEASYEAVRLNEGMFDVQQYLRPSAFTGLLTTPDDIVLEDAGGTLYALKGLYANQIPCLDCEICDNGIDDDLDLDIDCNDDECGD